MLEDCPVRCPVCSAREVAEDQPLQLPRSAQDHVEMLEILRLCHVVGLEEINDKTFWILRGLRATDSLTLHVLKRRNVLVRQGDLATRHLDGPTLAPLELDHFRPRRSGVIDGSNRSCGHLPSVLLWRHMPDPWHVEARIVVRAFVPTDGNVQWQAVAYHLLGSCGKGQRAHFHIQMFF